MTIADEPKFFEALARVSEAATLGDALANVQTAVRSLGFERYALVDRQGKRGRSFAHHNAPSDWLSTSDDIERNPIIKRSMSSPIPFIWDRSLFASWGEEALWAEQAAHGCGIGMCASYGASDSRAFIVVGASRDALPVDEAIVPEYFGNLLLLAGACLAALQRLVPEEQPAAPAVKLRPRELECLQWILQNKTAWEISKILGISERTVNQHLARARAELGVAKTRVAATRALQLELLPRHFAA